jgi:hypothetical protein
MTAQKSNKKIAAKAGLPQPTKHQIIFSKPPFVSAIQQCEQAA